MKKKYLSLVIISVAATIATSYTACSPSHSFREIEAASNGSLNTNTGNPSDGTPIPNPSENSQPSPTPSPAPAPLPAPAPAPIPNAPPVNSKTWTNEPAGSSLLVDCGMDTVDCNGALTHYYSVGGVTQLSDGSVAYYSQLPRNAESGIGGFMAYYKQGAGIPELFVGMRWKNNIEFQGESSGYNSIFYMRAFENPAGGESVSGGFVLAGPQYGPWQLVFRPNINQGTRCTQKNGYVCEPNVTNIPIERDKWYHIEAYIRASSCLTCNDAVVRWWVNGKLIGNYTNLHYGTNVINEFVHSPNWDGTYLYQCANRDCSKEWIHYIDHLRISAPQCGPGGCALTGQ